MVTRTLLSSCQSTKHPSPYRYSLPLDSHHKRDRSLSDLAVLPSGVECQCERPTGRRRICAQSSFGGRVKLCKLTHFGTKHGHEFSLPVCLSCLYGRFFISRSASQLAPFGRACGTTKIYVLRRCTLFQLAPSSGQVQTFYDTSKSSESSDDLHSGMTFCVGLNS